ncbi:protein of unknown function (DU1801) [Agrococcus baldri]|uniref:YdhG-like domain-containing protein n=1 Tax=Agrococcus baldri TaxID=153730 RepID=A0AA94KYZ8_9MICO|nr:DUF1801 domain-containing protein [Agrococcus baldri]SFS03132.1 protein of unknown function (DU1801) [Agrococcus baldri]
MAEQKTKPTDASVEAFLDAAEPPRRVEEGHRLVAIMREETGEEPVLWGPSIIGFGSYHYVSPSKTSRAEGDWPKVGFSPRKGALSLYGLKDLPEGAALLPQLGGYTEGAGCVYVKRLEQVDEAVLRQLIRIAHARGEDPARDA